MRALRYEIGIETLIEEGIDIQPLAAPEKRIPNQLRFQNSSVNRMVIAQAPPSEESAPGVGM